LLKQLCLFQQHCRVYLKSETSQSIAGAFSNMFGFWYNFVFALLIIFTYFYTAITVPTNKMADDLKRSGGFIPGVKPGIETSDFLDKIMSLITFPGSLFLALIAVFPAIVVSLWCATILGNVFWRNLFNNYGWCCNRYYSTNKFIFIE
jgi:preprotein translocase subunit SecY